MIFTPPYKLLTLCVSALLLCGCDTILQYPDEPGVDPKHPYGALELDMHFNLEFEKLGEYEYDFENPSSPSYSRADAPDLFSHLQRYVINVYPVGSKSAAPYATFVRSSEILNSTPDPILLNLPPAQYRVVVWADYVPANESLGHYYDASDFNEIVLNNANGHPGSNHFRDAFYGETTVTVRTSTERTEHALVELSRPMARYTFVSNDLREFIDKERARTNSAPLYAQATLADYKVRMVYTRYMPCSFNVHTGKPADSRVGVEYHSQISVIDADNAQLAFDYVFTNGVTTAISVAMEVIHSDGTVVARMPQFDVPLRRSHYTLVTGKFLTTKSGGDINIDNEFTGEFNIEIK